MIFGPWTGSFMLNDLAFNDLKKEKVGVKANLVSIARCFLLSPF